MSTKGINPEAVPHNCPGPEGEQAGKADACAGCPNQSICASAPKGPDPDIGAITERMKNVKRKILILSGKGGVGKSTFSSQLSWAFAQDPEKQIGLMDIDICGPSIPKIMGLEGEQVHQSGMGWSPVYVGDDNNLAVMSVGFLLNSPDEAIIWRGPKKNGLIKQFLRDVNWGDLDYLLIDTPPGTSDEHISIAQYLKATNLDGAVIVTTPQEVALADVRKEINFCRKVGIPVIGIVENMSGFVCPNCKSETKIFSPTTGGAEKLAQEMGLTLLGKVPIDPLLARSCDEGVSYFERATEKGSVGVEAFMNVYRKIAEIVETKKEA